jgi:hypothetical protein
MKKRINLLAWSFGFLLLFVLISNSITILNGQNHDMPGSVSKPLVQHASQQIILSWNGSTSLSVYLNELAKTYTIVQVIPTQYYQTMSYGDGHITLTNAVIIVEKK